MSQYTITIPSEGGISPKAWYQDIRTSPGFVDDAAQAAAIDELDVLWHQLVEFKFWGAACSARKCPRACICGVVSVAARLS